MSFLQKNKINLIFFILGVTNEEKRRVSTFPWFLIEGNIMLHKK